MHFISSKLIIILWCVIGELRDFYSLTPIAVVGGSFLLGLAGHNISEAAAAGCAVLTGHYLDHLDCHCIKRRKINSVSWYPVVLLSGHNVGHFSHMVAEMQHVNPLSVLQVCKICRFMLFCFHPCTHFLHLGINGQTLFLRAGALTYYLASFRFLVKSS